MTNNIGLAIIKTTKEVKRVREKVPDKYQGLTNLKEGGTDHRKRKVRFIYINKKDVNLIIKNINGT